MKTPVFDPANPNVRCPQCLQPLPDPDHDPTGTLPGFCSLCGGMESEWEPDKHPIVEGKP